jgi:hypothetical protein
MSKMFYTVTDEKNRNTQNMHLQFCQIQMYKEEIGLASCVLVAPLALAQWGLGLSSFCSHSAIIIVHQLVRSCSSQGLKNQ